MGNLMQKETVRRYSLAFKQQVVREYEAGVSIYKLRDKYGYLLQIVAALSLRMSF
jgi:transposase-like protein